MAAIKTQSAPKLREDVEQQHLIEWAAWQANLHPELDLLYHVPNEGKRTKAAGGKQKAMGLRRGVPDLCLPVARNGAHGLYIEMKVNRNKPTKDQLWWHEQLMKQGYQVAVCYSCEAAAKEIMLYLTGSEETGLITPKW